MIRSIVPYLLLNLPIFFFVQAVVWHPDKHMGSEESRIKAESMFKEVGEAFHVLSDDQKRAAYDSGQVFFFFLV